MKLKFGFATPRYRGLLENANRLFAPRALVNVFMVCRECGMRSWVGPPRMLGRLSNALGPESSLVITTKSHPRSQNQCLFSSSTNAA